MKQIISLILRINNYFDDLGYIVAGILIQVLGFLLILVTGVVFYMLIISGVGYLIKIDNMLFVTNVKDSLELFGYGFISYYIGMGILALSSYFKNPDEHIELKNKSK